ncbi:hypothetical protein CFAM422_005568 [Trichoderma lentiforme]|uniref:Uncharacterized protein n=1 Tax=Trichoderma lentiforme TaxID=1567552 RepID=A0A9P5CEE0_9HYPO|nr:hypothetical protein CFAM422_005568 [Trichoderma lentiforme]
MRSYIYTYKARSLIHSKPRNTEKNMKMKTHTMHTTFSLFSNLRFDFSLRCLG